ncbi:MAG: DMT family transporter [Candidatus Thalassarchaeaceae archaeon]|jgi:drug/metabolite transporter (DMT)-like permease|nr:DMT family transporter [Candidatus Thalassarchaeaceae archaeon]|tara:strand:- start:341 stop:1240 length:900 start_codon:yes stop_codon:yes gene_type:complete
MGEHASSGPEYVAPRDSPRIAVLWMVFGSFSFGTMNALVKWTSTEADVWMIILVRSAVIAFAVAGYAAARGISLRVNDPKTMFLRCAVGLLAMILYFTALSRIPIGQAVTLQYTAPLFVALLSGTVIREKVSPSVVGLVVFAFAGIVLIVSPDLRTVEPDAVLALGSGLFAALAYIYVRELRKTDSASTVVFWFAAFSVAGSLFQAAPDIPDLSLEAAAALVGIGVGAGCGQVGITMAYHQANAAWVSAFSYLTVIVATFYGWLIFGETLGVADWVGGALIIGSGIVLIFVSPNSTEEE